MPELPEMEYAKNNFLQHSLNIKIKDLDILYPKIVKGQLELKEKLAGQTIKTVRRRGKFLITELSTGQYLVFHFSLAGKLIWRKAGQDIDEDALLAFRFEDGHAIEYRNPRRLGRIVLVEDANEIQTIATMGPEVRDVDPARFWEILQKNKRKNIKALLMDQKIIAGIGNRYSDEILFQTEINPKLKANALDQSQADRLFSKMKQVLDEAVNLMPNSFTTDWLAYHRRGNMLCPKDPSHRLKKEKIAGRDAVYCPEHQAA